MTDASAILRRPFFGDDPASYLPSPARHQPAYTQALHTPLFEDAHDIIDWADTDTYQTFCERMESDNDFIFCIAPSSKTPMSGTSKTTAGIQFCRAFNKYSDHAFNAREQASLNSTTVADEYYPELAPRRPILWDEAQGTRQSQGADARRSMADEVMYVSRQAAIHRWKQLPLVIITQSTRWLDSRMMDIIDRLLLIQGVDHDQGVARGVVFDHYYDDLGDSKREFTPAKEDLYWRPLPDDDPDYQYLTDLKAASGSHASGDGEAEQERELSKEERVELATYLWENTDLGQDQIGDVPKIDRSQSWVSRHV